MRTLYVQPGHARKIRIECHVIFVSPLLRELIVRAMQLPALYDESGMEGRLMELILDEVVRLPAQPLGLRWHNQARLLRAFELLERGHSVTRTAVEVGYSGPSAFAKMFRRTLGKSPRALRAPH